MFHRLSISVALLALLASMAGSAPAQQWNGGADSHYARGLSQPTAIAPAAYAEPAQAPSVAGHAQPLSPDESGGPNREPLRLARRSSGHDQELQRSPPTTPMGAVGSVGGSLAIVLGLFMAIVWFSRKLSPAALLPLPKEAVELLGRAPLDGRQQMQLVRLGNKLVLLGVTAAGAAPLAEVTEPAEVERLTALCRRGQPGSASASFTQLLNQIGSEPAPAGFVGETSPRSGAARTRT